MMSSVVDSLKVRVYVEGPADVFALRALLRSLIEESKMRGVSIEFFPASPGQNKESVLLRVPERAATILRTDPNSIVVAMPDLYPQDIIFAHSTPEELRDELTNRFKSALEEKGHCNDNQITDRFKVFCFKHEMEVLLLAAEESLKRRLGTQKKLRVSWTTPVEDQNFDNPPKKVIEKLFGKHHKKYISKFDASVILKNCDYRVIADRCSQCFKPFVDFLSNLPDY